MGPILNIPFFGPVLPKTLVVRELRYENRRPDFQTRKVILLTTLLDDAIYSEKALADLCCSRWV